MTIQKINAQSPETQSADLIADNVAKLKALFPELLTETDKGAAINLDTLKALVGDATATDAEEKYGLNWHGKRRARQLALTPSTGTLRPCSDESVDWDSTQNLMIEGDNLEVLKLLQKSYTGKVKLIYIDPPYNTGKDFVYPDNFQDNIKNYLELTGQIEGGAKISSNTEAGGRFHTDWLNMMYPRLKLARNLLRDDGVIFVSIDEREVGNLRILLDEVFGEENGVGEFIWQAKKGGGSDNAGVVNDHEYVICYAKNIENNPLNQILIEAEPLTERDEKGLYRRGRELNKWGANSLRKDRPTMYFPIPGPNGEDVYPIRNDNKEGCWRWGKVKMLQAAEAKDIEFVSRGNGTYIAYEKIRTTEARGKPHRTLLSECGQTADGTKAIKQLFDEEKVFDFSKPPALISKLLEIGSSSGDDPDIEEAFLVLDFFAGSGTTAQSTFQQNIADGGTRRYILVQLPEPLDPASKEQKIAADYCDKIGKPRTIVELTKERLRRAAAEIKAENPMFGGDTGFRVFKLDSSNIRSWSPDRDDLAASLYRHAEHIVQGRSESDVLYELLLKLGLDLCVPIEKREITGKTVHNIGGGTLVACLDENIRVADAEALALGITEWRKEQHTAGDTTAVFRDSAFENDVAKTNLAAILEQHGIKQVRSL
jgi:adenine-specific DNA-methyltransferase